MKKQTCKNLLHLQTLLFHSFLYQSASFTGQNLNNVHCKRGLTFTTYYFTTSAKSIERRRRETAWALKSRRFKYKSSILTYFWSKIPFLFETWAVKGLYVVCGWSCGNKRDKLSSPKWYSSYCYILFYNHARYLNLGVGSFGSFTRNKIVCWKTSSLKS